MLFMKDLTSYLALTLLLINPEGLSYGRKKFLLARNSRLQP